MAYLQFVSHVSSAEKRCQIYRKVVLPRSSPSAPMQLRCGPSSITSIVDAKKGIFSIGQAAEAPKHFWGVFVHQISFHVLEYEMLCTGVMYA